MRERVGVCESGLGCMRVSSGRVRESVVVVVSACVMTCVLVRE